MQKVKSIYELKDSQLMFEKDIPSFGYMLLVIVFFLLVGIGISGFYIKKPSYIVSNGIVSNVNTSYVMPSYSGEIEEMYIEEGSVVEKGDDLFKIKDMECSLQLQQLEYKKRLLEEEIDQYQILKKSIKDDRNYFDIKKSEDQLFYNMYETYKAQVGQKIFDGTDYIAYDFSDEKISYEIEKNQNIIAEIYYTTINNVENIIVQNKKQMSELDSQINVLNKSKDGFITKASSSGVVHMISELGVGAVVQSGTPMAIITPENSELMITSYINVAEMARINKGDKVSITVEGLAQNVYGNINGYVYSIDSNVSSSTNGMMDSSYFKIKVKPTSDYLVSKYGKKVNIVNGMGVETKIIYDEMTYFDYVVEKLCIIY